jgi:type I restriction enzyme M protein
LGQAVNIPVDLQAHVSQAKLTDLLDFSRKDFNKAFSLTVEKDVLVVDSKWDFVKLEKLNSMLRRGKSTKYGNSSIQVIKSGQARGYKSFDFKEKYFAVDGYIADERNLQKNDILINTTGVGTAGRVTLFNLEGDYIVDSHITILRTNDLILPEYLINYLTFMVGFKYLESLAQGASGQIELSLTTIQDFKIPLPPLNIQQEIVAACEVLDEAVRQAHEMVKSLNSQLADMFLNQQFSLDKLANVAFKVSDSIDPQQQIGTVNYIGLENIESQTGQLVGDISTEYQMIKSNKTCFIKDDVLYGKLRPNLNKVYLAKQDGICSTDILVFRFKNKDLAKFYNYYLRTESFNQAVLQTVSGQQLPRTSWGAMQDIKIPVPPLTEQADFVAQIEAIETKIAEAQRIIDQAPAQKQAVLRQYL